jgi:uncharacterized protein YbdZ (MbtH family)
MSRVELVLVVDDQQNQAIVARCQECGASVWEEPAALPYPWLVVGSGSEESTAAIQRAIDEHACEGEP